VTVVETGGEESEDAALMFGLSRPYIAIVVVLGIVGLAVIILVTVIATVISFRHSSPSSNFLL